MRMLFILLTLVGPIGSSEAQKASEYTVVQAKSEPPGFVDPLKVLNDAAPLRYRGSGLQSLDEIPAIVGVSERCRPFAIQLNQLLAEYHAEALRSQKEDSREDVSARGIHAKIKAILRGLEKTESVCFEPVARSYTLASLAYFEPRAEQVLLRVGLYLSAVAHGYYLGASGSKRIFETWDRRFNPLTEKKREDFGCRFKMPGQRHKYAIYGTYSCSFASVYVDPYLPPLNLGSAAIHEIVHLMSEVLGSETYVDSQTRTLRMTVPFQGGSELRQWMTFDEVMASTIGGFLQRRMEARGVKMRAGWIDHALESNVRTRHKKFFQLKQDNTLFKRKDGHLAKIESADIGPDTNITDFMLKSGLLACGDPKARVRNAVHWTAIYDQVHSTTFGTATLEAKDAKFLPFSKERIFEDPYLEEYWRDVACIAQVPVLTLWKHKLPKGSLDGLGAMSSLYSALLEDAPANMTQAQILIEKMHKRIVSTSGICQQMNRAVHSTREFLRDQMPKELEGILKPAGSPQISSLAQEHIRMAPLLGHINVCLSKSSGRPVGTEGVRTEDEGGPAGTEGVRTDLEAIQACDESTGSL